MHQRLFANQMSDVSHFSGFSYQTGLTGFVREFLEDERKQRGVLGLAHRARQPLFVQPFGVRAPFWARFHCKSNWLNSSWVQSAVMGFIVPAAPEIVRVTASAVLRQSRLAGDGTAASGRVFAEEELAVVASAEEGEAVQVGAQGVRAVGGVADEAEQ